MSNSVIVRFSANKNITNFIFSIFKKRVVKENRRLKLQIKYITFIFEIEFIKYPNY